MPTLRYIAAGLIASILTSCTQLDQKPVPVTAAITASGQADDETEKLVRHLLKRISALDTEMTKVRATPDINGDLEMMTQWMLDSEASIEDHNRRHPDRPWADTEDILREMCGDCTKSRARRAAEIKAESGPAPY